MSLRFFKRTTVCLLLLVGLIASSQSVFAAGIIPGFQQSTFLDQDLDNDTFPDVINWIPDCNGGSAGTGCPNDVTVSDTELTGDIWAESAGWIRLNCADSADATDCALNNNFHVANDGSGNLSGYAWGENTGYISFWCGNETVNNCSSNGNFRVTIDPVTGEFDGYAWSHNFGWIKFDCSGSDTAADADSFIDTCVKTDWAPTVVTPPGGGDTTGSGSTLSSCSITASPTSLTVGGSTLLTWTTNISPLTSATIFSTATGNTAYPTTPSGSVYATPPETTTYIATFDGPFASGGPVSCSVTVPVTGEIITPPAPPDDTLPTGPDTTPTGGPTTGPTTGPTGPTGPGSGPFVSPGDEFGCATGDCTTTQPFSMVLAGILPSANTLRAIALAGLVLAAITNIPGAFFRLQNLFLAWLGFRKRRREWGVVYDSVTKQPLDPAYVVLSDMQGNEIASSITDLDGRYGFLVPPGIYQITAGKTHYQFPSRLLAGKQKDDLYDNLYFGGEIEIKRDDEVITRNIPMDPVDADWNEIAKRQQQRFGFFKKADIFWHKIINGLFWAGFALAVFVTVIAPVPLNFIILGLYVFMLILSMTGWSGRKYGKVADRSGNPLAFAIIRVFNAQLHTEVAHKVTNANGRYYSIIPKGRYYITVERKNADGTYTKVFTSSTMDIKHGILKNDFKTL